MAEVEAGINLASELLLLRLTVAFHCAGCADLEYQPACNPGLDGEAMVSGVLTVVGDLFQV